MGKGELLDVLIPSPEEWAAMEQGEFQEKMGKCMAHLLRKEQGRTAIDTLSSFFGGVIGGFLALLGMKGVA